MAKRFKKILVLAVIFTMTVVNYGLPLHAIAAEGESFFSFAFFKKNEISLDAYFADDSKDFDETTDVNKTAKITLEVTPQIEGYLKSGTLKFNLKNGNENNFRLKSVTIEEKAEFALDTIESEKLEGVKKLETVEESSNDIEKDMPEEVVSEKIVNEIKSEEVVEPKNEKNKNPFSGLFKSETTSDVKEETVDSEKTEEKIKSENVVEEDILVENVVSDESVEKEEVKPEDEKEDKKDSEVADKDDEVEDLEEKSISEVIEDVKGTYEVSLINENEIALKNIIDPTKIFVEVAYKQLEKVNLEDIYSEIEIDLNGNYINKKLENVEINRKQYLNLGWEYSKELNVTSDFTKVSPFTVGQNSGTILENIITIARNVEDTNFLPIKETNIKIEIPKINDKLPIAVNVAANKLMATLGKDLTGKEFNKNNWSYDEETGVIEIKVTNKDMFAGNGEDKFDIICRYEDYLEDESIVLDKKLSVKVEEYSANKNNIQEIQIEEAQEKEVIAGELMSYAIIENEEDIGKGKINANYYVEAGETRFSSTVNVTVLTSDILSEVVIEPVKESYKMVDGTEFDATQDVMYAGVRFNLAEIKEMLEQGSTIDLLDSEGNVFHTITKDVDATKIEFAHKIDCLKVRINNVKVNGNLSIEFIKAIDKCQYSQAEFVGFEKIENTYKADVKYVGFEDIFQLPEIKEEIKFKDTITQVNFLMNTSSLATIYQNDNVEFKVDLLNNLETSDLYKNPSFEIVFPTYVKEVSINNIYTLYQNGLSIRDYNVIDINGLKRIVVNLEGTQSGFNFSNITNGTNIIINANISVDEITPQKQDQIELYYCNEIATNYQTQASWNMTRTLPEGALKDTNGYDAIAFEYQAPSGMITINSITNYDGIGSTIKSINQGEVIKTIPIKGESQYATMELSVLNNTGSDCTGVVLLGRIPFKGNKDVVTGDDLGTNVDTLMKTILIPDEVNSNNTTIYYSNNPNADRDLNNEANGWSTTHTEPSAIKSFMIVVDGVLERGGILKFKYDFEIPANLGYEVKMLGSFGAFYNDFDVLKTSVADKVGLLTEAGAKYEATMSVNIGDGAEIGEHRELVYTVKVKNTGSIDLTNVKIENTKPNFGEIKNAEEKDGDTAIYKIDKLLVGEEKEKQIIVKAASIPKNLESYIAKIPNILIETGEDGKTKYYTLTEDNKKVYISELPEEIFIENFATVYVDNTINGVKTNTVKNKLVDSKFDIEIEEYNYVDILNPGETFKYIIDVCNTTEEPINNVEVEYFIPKELKYLKTESYIDDEFEEKFYEETNLSKVSIDSIEPGFRLRYAIHCEVATKNISEVNIENYVTVTADNDIKERSDTLVSLIHGPELILKQETNVEDNVVKELEIFDVVVNINNNGKAESQKLNFEVNIPDGLKIKNISSEGKRLINYSTNGNTVLGTLNLLEAQSESSFIIKVQANPLNEGETNAILEVNSKVSEAYIGELDIKPLSITVIDDPDRELSDEEKKEEEKNNTAVNPDATDGYKEDIEKDKDKDKEESNNANSNIEQDNNPDNNQNNNQDNNNQNDGQDNSQNNQPEINDSEDETVKEIENYKISGKVWKDENKNNAKDSNEKGMKEVRVSIYEGATKLKSVVTDSLGKYRFTELPVGNYTIVFEYDGDTYIAAQYKMANIVESENSDAIESEAGMAVTEVIKIADSDVEIDFGIQERNMFDIEVQKYISKAIVNTKGKEKVQTYNNESIAKLEIRSKELAKTSIDLEYKIVVTNVGDVSGTVGRIYDYLPKELTFNESNNKDWKLEADGVIYNDSLERVVIKAGESKEIKLVLSKVMTNDNTGTISNKVQIDKLSSDKAIEENLENNIATQEMIITISTGRTISLVVMITLMIMATVVIYGIKTGKIKKAYK